MAIARAAIFAIAYVMAWIGKRMGTDMENVFWVNLVIICQKVAVGAVVICLAVLLISIFIWFMDMENENLSVFDQYRGAEMEAMLSGYSLSLC